MQVFRLGCSLLLVGLLPLAGLMARPVSAHDFSGRCEVCHLSEPGSGTLIFRDDMDTLCRQCHTLSGDHHHPSQRAATLAVPEDFWLDEQNRINCATCHDPHPPETATYPDLLRREASDAAFCLVCHEQAVRAGGEHVGVTLLAHGKPFTPPQNSGNELDRISQDCVSCHDGSGGPHAGFCLYLEKERGGCGSHIIGLNYDETAAQNPELSPRQGLSPNISFYEGKIGCLSCHSIYSDQRRMLAVDNRSSALCLECHRK